MKQREDETCAMWEEENSSRGQGFEHLRCLLKSHKQEKQEHQGQVFQEMGPNLN